MITIYTTDNEKIEYCTRELKLPTIKNSLEDAFIEATTNQWDYKHFLANVLKREVEQRIENRKYQRIRKATFPQMKYLVELEKDLLPSEGRSYLPEFETLNFIKEKRNIVMYGNPGTGKTHIAIGLGLKACLEGYSVYFTSVPQPSLLLTSLLLVGMRLSKIKSYAPLSLTDFAIKLIS